MILRFPLFLFFFLLSHFHHGLVAQSINEENSAVPSKIDPSHEMKVLILIPSSDGLPVYAELEKIWRSYMKLDPDHVEAYFLKSNPDMEKPCELIGDTLWAKTTETFYPGMTLKTLLAMEYLLPRLNEFDYVVRTNLSSFFVFPRLFKFLKTLPKKECYAAHIDSGTHEKCCTSWGCGAGLYFSPDLIELFVKNKENILNDPYVNNTFDDVFISYFFQNKNIKLLPAPRMEYHGTRSEWINHKPFVSEETFHIKIKHPNPSLRLANDPYLLSQYVKMFYPSANLSDLAITSSEEPTPIMKYEAQLKEEPENAKLMFQLALAYESEQKHSEAIKWFKSRIEKEGDKEEVWGSMYRLAEVYNAMGSWGEALQWYQAAYDKLPERAEPLLKISQHYRKAGQNNLSYLYAKQGSLVLPPKENSLFYSPSVHTYDFDEELSIGAYYTPHKEEGYSAVNHLILKRKVPEYIREKAFHNLLYYLEHLKDATYQPVLFDLPLIREGLDLHWNPTNPSIQRTETGYQVIAKTVNYAQECGRDYHLIDTEDKKSNLAIRNYLLKFDHNFNKVSQHEITEKLERPRHKLIGIDGIEDLRMFEYHDAIWAVCTSFDTSPYGKPQTSLCKLAQNNSGENIEVEKLIPLIGPNPERVEKNWLPFVKDDQIYLIYSYDPFIIYKPNLETGACEQVLNYSPTHNFSSFRSSAGPVEFDEGYLILVHEVIYKSNPYKRHDVHRLLFLDKNFTVKSLSKPFKFKHDGIEYSCGMTIDHSGTKLIITFGIEDRDAQFCFLPLNTIRSILEPLPDQFNKEALSSLNNLILNKAVPFSQKHDAFKDILSNVQNLKNTRFLPIEIQLPVIRADLPYHYNLMNSSIQKTDDGYVMICRAINYIQTGVESKYIGLRENEKTVCSKNFLVHLDRNFSVSSQQEIEEKLPRYRNIKSYDAEGLEDCRIFEFDKSYWFSCTTLDTNPGGPPQMSLCKLEKNGTLSTINVEKLTPLKGSNPQKWEKNWLPFIKDHEIHFIYAYDPLVIYKPNLETGTCEIIASHPSNHYFEHLRGSAGPIEFDEGYLLLVHEVVFGNSRTYLNRFIFFDKDFKIQMASKPFTFKHLGTEICCGMTIDHAGEQLIMPVSLEDKEANLCFVDLNTVRSMLEKLPN